MGTRQKVEKLFTGDWVGARLGAPTMYPRDRAEVAVRAWSQADLWPFCDPRQLAVELGFVVGCVGIATCGREGTADGVIWYRGHADRRERGLALLHGLSHALLAREGWRHSEADAWWLTGDLAVPRAVLRSCDADEIARNTHAPEWFSRSFVAVADRGVAPLRLRVA